MKKSLNLLLALALVFSMFSSLAFAADSDLGAKLKNAGVLQGGNDGNLKEDEQWERQDVTVIIARFLGAVEEAEATERNHGFTDVDIPYYDSYITWAKDNEYFNGKSDAEFGFKQSITNKEFAAVMLRVLGVDVDEDWFSGDVEAKAVEFGIFPEDTEWNEQPKRGDLFPAIAATIQIERADGTTIAEEQGYEGFYEEVDGATEIRNASITGAKKIAVTFDGDASEASFSLKKGAVVVAIDETDVSEDGKVATITAVDKFTQGTYTVTVSGIEGLAKDSVDVVAVNEAITSMELTGEVLPKSDAAKLGLVVKNQYGEEMTINPSTLTWVFSDARATSNHDTVNNVARVDISHADLKADSFLTVTVVATNGAQTSKTYKIGEAAKVNTISMTELVLDDKDAARLTSGGTATIKYDARDQYGNAIDTMAMLKGHDGSDPTVSDNVRLIKNSANVTVEWVEVDSKAVIKVTAGANANSLVADETVVVTAVTETGNTNSFTFQAYKAPTVDTVTVSGPTSVVADGDTNVYLNITAVDQFGATMSAKQLADAYAASPVNNRAVKAYVAGVVTAGTISVDTNVGDNQGKLLLPAITGNGTVTLTVVSATGKSTSVTFEVQPERYLAKVEFKDMKATKLLQGATTTTGLKYIDQYGKEWPAVDDTNSKVNVKLEKVSGDDAGLASSLNGDIADNTTAGSITLTAAADKKGTYKLTVKIVKDDDSVTYSTISQNFVVTTGKTADNDPLTYEVSAIPTLWEGGANAASPYAETVSVEAKDSAGVKVAVPTSTIYSVSTSNDGVLDVSVTGSTYKVFGLDKGVVVVTVILNTPDGNKVVTSNVTVSDEAPVAQSLTSEKEEVVYNLAPGSVNLLTDGNFKFAVKDQYGKTALTTQAGELSFVIVHGTNVQTVQNTAPTYNFAAAGDYTITAITKNGISIAVKVKVNN